MGKNQKTQQHHPQGFSRIEQLPDDVMLLIVSLLPTLAEISRTSILSRRWRNIWHGVTCLDFDATKLPHFDRFNASSACYIEWVTNVLQARLNCTGIPPVKKLQIWCALGVNHSCHIDRWIGFAISNRVEKLHLDFTPYIGFLPRKTIYKLSEEAWYKVPTGLSSLGCLKSLFFGSAIVSKQFIEFILSNCPLLEDLSFRYALAYNELNVAGPPSLRLRRLEVYAMWDFALNTLCAPHLTSIYYKSQQFTPQKIDVPSLNDLAIGGYKDCQPILQYLKHFWSYLPQLEKLELFMNSDNEFNLNPIPELIKLKYLKICADWDTNPFVDQIMNFIEACPVLETFAFQMIDGSSIPTPTGRRGRKRHRKEEQYIMSEPRSCFSLLKVLQLFGGGDKAINQDIVKFIINKSPYLQKLTVDVRSPRVYPQLQYAADIVEAVKAKAIELCQGRPLSEVKIVVLGNQTVTDM